MLDVVFWWCAVVALAGSATLIGMARFTGCKCKTRPARVELFSETPVVMRHFGRA